MNEVHSTPSLTLGFVFFIRFVCKQVHKSLRAFFHICAAGGWWQERIEDQISSFGIANVCRSMSSVAQVARIVSFICLTKSITKLHNYCVHQRLDQFGMNYCFFLFVLQDNARSSRHHWWRRGDTCIIAIARALVSFWCIAFRTTRGVCVCQPPKFSTKSCEFFSSFQHPWWHKCAEKHAFFSTINSFSHRWQLITFGAQIFTCWAKCRPWK